MITNWWFGEAGPPYWDDIANVLAAVVLIVVGLALLWFIVTNLPAILGGILVLGVVGAILAGIVVAAIGLVVLIQFGPDGLTWASIVEMGRTLAVVGAGIAIIAGVVLIFGWLAD